jgi:hypothetical protein
MEHDEAALIEGRMSEWIRSANAVWNELIQLPQEQRGRRLDDFTNQLLEQQKNLSDLKQANPNSERFRPLEGQLIELLQKVRREREKERLETLEKQRQKLPSFEEHELTPRPRIEEPVGVNQPSEMSEQADLIKRRLEMEGTPIADDQKALLEVPQADDLQAWLYAKEHELKRDVTEVIPGDIETMHKNDEIYTRFYNYIFKSNYSYSDY